MSTKIEPSARPYHIFAPKKGKYKKGQYVRYYCFSNIARAHARAHDLVGFEKTGMVLEVIHIDKMEVMGTYVRTVHGVTFDRKPFKRDLKEIVYVRETEPTE